ncbi:MATE family efflux transporter [Wenyingzhuangia sp. IMCC45574]
MSTANRIIKNTGFLYIKMGITMFISLYTTRLVLNALGASDFGVFNVVGGAIAMLGFLHAAMSAATQRFMSFYEGKGEKQKQKEIFNVSVVLHFLIAIVLGLILLVAGYFFLNGILNIEAERIYAAKVVYGALIISTVFTVMTVPYEAVLNAHENMLYYSIVGVLESLLKLTVALIIVNYAGDKLELYGILMACIPLLVLTIMRIYCHQNYEECTIAPKKYWDKSLMREMTSFAGWSFLGSATGMISQYGMGIVLNSFFGTILNAALGIANQISGQLMTFSNTMMKAVNPVIAKSEGKGDRKLMLSTTLSSSKFSFWMLALFAIPFIVESQFVLKFWIKNVPQWAVIFSVLQLIRSLIEQLTIMLPRAISAQGDIRCYTIYRSVLNFLPLGLTYVGFKYNMPPYFLYIVWIVITSILGGLVSLYFVKWKCGLSYGSYIKDVLLPCSTVTILMLITGFLIKNFMEVSFLRLLLVCVTTTITFIIFVYNLFLSKEEKKIIVNIYLGVRNKILK